MASLTNQSENCSLGQCERLQCIIAEGVWGPGKNGDRKFRGCCGCQTKKHHSPLPFSWSPLLPLHCFPASPPHLTLSSACHTVREERRSSREHSQGWLRMLGRSRAAASREAMGREWAFRCCDGGRKKRRICCCCCCAMSRLVGERQRRAELNADYSLVYMLHM